MNDIYTAFLTVAVLVFTAELLSSALHRFKAPDLVGQITAGMIVGPLRNWWAGQSAPRLRLESNEPRGSVGDWVIGFMATAILGRGSR